MRILKHAAQVWRPVYTTSRAGDRVGTWEPSRSPFTREFTSEFGTPRGGVLVGVEPAFFQLRNSSEDSDHRDRLEVKGRLFLAAGADIDPLYQVVWTLTGQRFEVVGPPRLICRPAGPHHIEVDIREVSDAQQLLPA